MCAGTALEDENAPNRLVVAGQKSVEVETLLLQLTVNRQIFPQEGTFATCWVGRGPRPQLRSLVGGVYVSFHRHFRIAFHLFQALSRVCCLESEAIRVCR